MVRRRARDRQRARGLRAGADGGRGGGEQRNGMKAEHAPWSPSWIVPRASRRGGRSCAASAATREGGGRVNYRQGGRGCQECIREIFGIGSVTVQSYRCDRGSALGRGGDWETRGSESAAAAAGEVCVVGRFSTGPVVACLAANVRNGRVAFAFHALQKQEGRGEPDPNFSFPPPSRTLPPPNLCRPAGRPHSTPRRALGIGHSLVSLGIGSIALLTSVSRSL